MRRIHTFLTLLILLPAAAGAALRPPAVPLVACDPYFSIWSEADRLTDDATRHWTRAANTLTSMVRIDGKVYRIMGDQPRDVEALPQTGLAVTPTRSLYTFSDGKVQVSLTFMNTALPNDLDALSRPLTYLTWEARSLDGASHNIYVFFSAAADMTVHTTDQAVVWSRQKAGPFETLRIGSEDQPVLERAGDATRIDWGYAYVAVPEGQSQRAIASQDACLAAFAEGNALPADDTRMPRPAKDDMPAMAVILPLGAVGSQPVARYAMLAYDDLYSMNYFGKRLKGYWARNGATIADLLQKGAKEYRTLGDKCAAFDADLVADLAKMGGEKYAEVCTLAYRESLAANKLCADAKGMPMLFPKENTSNGCVSTVDVIYPMEPMYLLISPMLAKASLAPVLNYTASPLWKFRYAPHDLGTYPRATRQVYAGDEDPAHEGDRMPVEESGNMILLLAAVAKEEGSAEFASQYWPQVTKWAQYLEEKGFDPANQLSTDDFTGHLAHNANLSVKAIEALAAYGMLCDMRGDRKNAAKYGAIAKEMAGKWVQAADDGDHFRLAFDKPGTWSQKYNMVWDTILGLNAFPPEVRRKEVAFYLRNLDPYGVALDNRQPYAKTDWSMWTATMTDNDRDWRAMTDPIWEYVNHTPERNPIADLYWTKRGSEVAMHARPVIGGVYLKMLTDSTVWNKWASRAPNSTARWAPLPKPPVTREVVPTAEKTPIVWRYTTEQPSGDWFATSYNDTAWKEGPGGFGTAGTPGAVVRTTWNTPDIWLRREFTMPSGSFPKLQISSYHDEDIEVYINGVLAARATGFVNSYTPLDIRPGARAALKPGRNVFAVHCHQTEGGQGVDVGLVETRER